VVKLRRAGVLAVAAVAIGALVTGSALADGTMTISFASNAKIVSKTEADLPFSVSCDALPNQTTGSVDVSVSQTMGSNTTTATGSSAITCDGQTHNYVVALVTSNGRWHNGPAAVSASGEAEGYYTVTSCGPDGNGGQKCVTTTTDVRDEGSAGPSAITLENG
jgi:hypothetical protein